MPQEIIFLFLCRHVVHASCVSGDDNLPLPPDSILRHLGSGSSAVRGLSGSIALYVFLFLFLFFYWQDLIFFFFLLFLFFLRFYIVNR